MTAKYNGLPLYDARIDSDDTGMIRISLVDDPAVCSDFLAFAAQKAPLAFKVTDEEKRLVRGVVMRAEFPMFRRSPDGFEYYVVYHADTIRAMAEKYLLEGRQNEVNIMHAEGSDVDGVQMVQYFLKDTAAGIAPEGFEDIADGSLFAEFHVVNDTVWDEVKAGTYKGFSLEGVFDLVPEQYKQQLPKKQDYMSKIKRFKESLRRLLASFAEVTTDKGVLGWNGDEDLKAGDAVYIVEEDGGQTPAPGGDYVTEDGKTIVVAEGKVAEIRDPEAEVEVTEENFGEVSTDKGVLYHEGEEDLKEGDEVTVEDENGERVPAADGEYRTEDGKVITVVDGKVASITDDRAEVAPEEAFRRIRQAFEETYNEKLDKIYEAIASLGVEDFYVEEAADDFAVVSVWDIESGRPRLYRYDLAWTEDGFVTASNPVEVKIAYVPVDEEVKVEETTTVTEEVEELRRQVAQLRKENATLKAKPAAKPAHEEAVMHSKATPTGVKGLDNLARLMGK